MATTASTTPVIQQPGFTATSTSTTTSVTNVLPTFTSTGIPSTFAFSALPDPKFDRFTPKYPEMWFNMWEAHLRSRGIVTEVDMYNHTSSKFAMDDAIHLNDVLSRRPANDIPFQTLRNTAILRFAKSREAAIIQLLDNESIGTRTPSQHLRHLRNLVSDIDEEILKMRWLSHLPEQIRACLATQKTASTDELAITADRISEVFHPSVASVQACSPEVDALRRQLASVQAQLAAVQRESRSRSRGPAGATKKSHSRSRSKSRSRIPKKYDTCYYHHRFGADARNCVPGCKFQGNKHESS